ncbi:hypothetical protein ACAX43_31565 [Paraburkholderia sp. IW21]|uniref:hypothetical protein n=1 Tax=Paraburkholderia sp. IW21 TaxID=3242488 RepID=UPI00351FAAED
MSTPEILAIFANDGYTPAAMSVLNALRILANWACLRVAALSNLNVFPLWTIRETESGKCLCAEAWSMLISLQHFSRLVHVGSIASFSNLGPIDSQSRRELPVHTFIRELALRLLLQDST